MGQDKGPSGGDRQHVRENVLYILVLISEYTVFNEWDLHLDLLHLTYGTTEQGLDLVKSINPFTTEGPDAGPYVNTVSSSDTWLIIITQNLPISIEVIWGDS